MSGLYHSYFDTVSTDRISTSPAKRRQRTQYQSAPEHPKKLSKAFTRQLAKTLSTTKKPVKRTGPASKKRKRTYPAKMPKRAAAESYDSDGGFVEDAPRSKKSKAGKGSSKAGEGRLPPKESDEKDGSVFWTIASKRRLQVSEFKGTTMVAVREYYEKDGEMLPGKKGISMTLEQFNMVVELLPQLESELKAKGVDLARPKYDQAAGGDVEQEEDEAARVKEEPKAEEGEADKEAVREEPVAKKSKSKLDKFKHKPKNHEATSDEDEG